MTMGSEGAVSNMLNPEVGQLYTYKLPIVKGRVQKKTLGGRGGVSEGQLSLSIFFGS